MTLPLAETCDRIVRSELAARRHQEARTFCRRLVRRIDVAIDECELANLAGERRPPRAAVELVAWLQEAAEVEVRRPSTTQEVLDALFRLQEDYLDGTPYDDDDQVADVEAAG